MKAFKFDYFNSKEAYMAERRKFGAFHRELTVEIRTAKAELVKASQEHAKLKRVSQVEEYEASRKVSKAQLRLNDLRISAKLSIEALNMAKIEAERQWQTQCVGIGLEG